MFTQLFSDSDLERWLAEFQEDAENAIVETLQDAGEKFVELARKNRSYDSHTGNLRSSIGYVIVYNGKLFKENFEKSDIGTDGEEGLRKARQLASEIASTIDGLALIGVAGMQYAAAVESKGFEVISNSSLQAEAWLKQSIETILKRAKS